MRIAWPSVEAITGRVRADGPFDRLRRAIWRSFKEPST